MPRSTDTASDPRGKEFMNFSSAAADPLAMAISGLFGKKPDQLGNHITIKVMTEIGIQVGDGLSAFNTFQPL